MPIASFKNYKCPKCHKEISLYQGDVLTGMPICPKCNTEMEFTNASPVNLFTSLMHIIKKGV